MSFSFIYYIMIITPVSLIEVIVNIVAGAYNKVRLIVKKIE